MAYILIEDSFYPDLKETLVGIGAVNEDDELSPSELVSIVEDLQPGSGGSKYSLSLLNLLGLKDFDLTIDSSFTNSSLLKGNTALKNVTVLSGVSLPSSCFDGCTGLEKADIRGGINARCFNGCSNLKLLTVDGGENGISINRTAGFTGVTAAVQYLILKGNLSGLKFPMTAVDKAYVSSEVTGAEIGGNTTSPGEVYTDALEGALEANTYKGVPTVYYDVSLDEFMDIIAEEEA